MGRRHFSLRSGSKSGSESRKFVSLVALPSSAAATAAIAAIPAATTTAAAAFRFRTGLINGQGPAAQFLPVQCRYGAFPFFIVRHFNECETLGAARIPVSDDTGAVYGSVSFKHGSNGFIRRPKIEISNKNVLHQSSFDLKSGQFGWAMRLLVPKLAGRSNASSV